MAARMPLDADAQKQLLALAETKGRAAQLYARFTPLVADLLVRGSTNSKTSADEVPQLLTLLQSAFGGRLESRIKAGLCPIAPRKKEPGSVTAVNADVQRQYAAFAAKLAQSVIKTYAAVAIAPGATDADKKINQDVFVAMDIAAAALFVVFKFERALKLGDLVIDNMLYQVAKKYAELSQGRSSAFYTLACLHVRLWRAHGELCESLRHSLTQHADCMTHLQVAESKISPASFYHIAEFPAPQTFHTVQFTRLLIGVLNTCVTVLVQAKQHQVRAELMIAAIATTLLRPWVDHLAEIPGADAKLATSFNDRIFRVIWKSATAVEAGKSPEKSLRVRSLALSFMMKCPNYTTLYLIQQVYRVGVQYERRSKRTPSDYQHVYSFYANSFDLVKLRCSSSSHIFKSDLLEWDFLLWLEHAASVCESADRILDGVLILDCAIRYLGLFPARGGGVCVLFLHSMVALLLGLSNVEKRESSGDKTEQKNPKSIGDSLVKHAEEAVRSVAQGVGTDSMSRRCEKAVIHYLKQVSDTHTTDFLSQCSHKSFLPFVVRCAKKSVTKVYNYTVTKKLFEKLGLRDLIISSFDKISEGIKIIRTDHDLPESDSTSLEALILSESRIRRMTIALAVHRHRDSDEAAVNSQLPLIARQVALVQRLLDDAMADDSSGGLLQGLLADINIIARECYNCAAHFYKKQEFETTISALRAAFELAESYMEYVMCNPKATATEIQKAHSDLKVDSLASLMALCFHEEGDIPKSRVCIGHSILYCSDVHDRTPLKSIDKYVSAMLEELHTDEGVSPKARALLDDFKAFVENIIHAFTARQVPDRQVVNLIHGFRRFFDLTSSKLTEKMRSNSSSEPQIDPTYLHQAIEGIRMCMESECYLSSLVLELGGKSVGEDEHSALTSLSQALSTRKMCYAMYYESLDSQKTIAELIQAHRLLNDAISSLPRKSTQDKIDLGGAYGWRGVIAMEVVLVSSYSKSSSTGIGEGQKGHPKISEENAIKDIEECVRHWESMQLVKGGCIGSLFDAHSIVLCLEAVCNSLSLISCPFLETSARRLLEKVQATSSGGDDLSTAWPPPSLELLNFHVGEPAIEKGDEAEEKAKNSSDGHPRNLPHFQQVDAEISLGVKHQSLENHQSAVRHLRNVIEMLSVIKADGVSGSVSKSTVLKAMGMRELLVHLVLSEIHFSEGRGKLAISEAKAALSICWKLSKKFASSSPSEEDPHFELPEDIKRFSSAGKADGSRNSSLIYFKALEFSSWDILHAVKLVLCRIGSLYSLTGQPHRSHLYYTEAMELVGGLNLRFFQRSPFYEYARLQLDFCRPEQAKAALQIIPLNHDQWTRVIQDSGKATNESRDNHSCFVSDSAFVEQYCNELVQQGGLHLADGDVTAALEAYVSAVKTLESRFKRQLPSTGLRKTRSRCYRKILHLKAARADDLSDPAAVEKLLYLMKKLEKCTKCCEDLLERIKSMHELGCVNILLLRSLSSSQALMSSDETTSLLEEAHALGDHLGLADLSKQLRSSLGTSYLVALEERDCIGGGGIAEGEDSGDFLPWASATLLSNSSTIEKPDNTSPTDGTPDLELDKYLEQLSSRLSLETRGTPREKIEEMVTSVKQQVRHLPSSWLIVSVAISVTSELVVSRIANDGGNPVSFCLHGIRWKSTTEKVEALIRASRESLSGNSADETGSWTTEKKKQWWNDRKEIDEELGAAIHRFQSKVGFWKCLFVRSEGAPSECVQRCWSILMNASAGTRKSTTKYEVLLGAMVETQRYLTDSEFSEGVRYIATELGLQLSDQDSARILQLVRDESGSNWSSSDQDQNSSNGAALLTLAREDISRMKVNELKDYLAAAGLGTDGLKKTLVERLVTARDGALAVRLSSSSRDVNYRRRSEMKSSTILILDHRLQELPWEGLDVMESCDSVTRMPSLELILKMFGDIQTRKRAATNRKPFSLDIRRERISFLLNAAGDLKSTENQLGPILNIGQEKFGWCGIVGRVPDEDEMRDYLLGSDLFIYCGHGSGEKYIHRDKILELKQGCSAALLFGCSSGRLEREGIFGPDGAVLSYLRAGSPAVLAMLWDVTDKDIDQLSVEVLREWLLRDDDYNEGSEAKRVPLARVLHQARQVCKLKYLNGYAAVCYGLPLHVAQ